MRKGILADFGVGVAIAMSFATMAMTLIDRTTDKAQSAEALDGRVRVLERTVTRRFVNDATNQLNYLCTTAKTCRQLYAPIAVPE